jgi:hypothetical protein
MIAKNTNPIIADGSIRHTPLSSVVYAEGGLTMNAEEVAAKMAEHEARLGHLEDYQKTQNGALLRVADRTDKLYYWVIATLGGVLANLFVAVAKKI